MKKFKSFFSDRINSEILRLVMTLEGVVQYHPDFIEKLKNISGESSVAQYLLSILNKEFKDDQLKQNFIKPTGLEDKITFLSQKKYLDNLSRGSVMDPYNMRSNETGVGRLRDLFKLTGQDFSSSEIEKFVNLYKSIGLSQTEKFKLIKGDDIAFWYSEDNYFSKSGTLGKSCMMDVDPDFFQIYTDSPNCQMLILTTNETGEEKLLGRAIIWKITRCYPKITDGDLFFMDRIYTNKDSDVNKFKKFSDDNGWCRKAYNDSDEETGMDLDFNGERKSCKLTVDLSIPGSYLMDFYPYLDTLKFMDQSGSELSNIGFVDGFILDSTTGDKDCCSFCDGSGYDGCSECLDREKVDCDTCDGRGERTCIICKGNGEKHQQCNICDGTGYSDDHCPECGGTGTRTTKKSNEKDCKYCSGKGKDSCESCKGSGEEVIECDNCDGGDGSVQCSTCDGDGEVECPVCDGGTKRPYCRYCTGLITRVDGYQDDF